MVEGSFRILTFVTPWIGVLMLRSVHKNDIVEIDNFFKSLLHQTRIRQTEGIVMVSSEGSTNIVNFMTRMAGVQELMLTKEESTKMKISCPQDRGSCAGTW